MIQRDKERMSGLSAVWANVLKTKRSYNQGAYDVAWQERADRLKAAQQYELNTQRSKYDYLMNCGIVDVLRDAAVVVHEKTGIKPDLLITRPAVMPQPMVLSLEWVANTIHVYADSGVVYGAIKCTLTDQGEIAIDVNNPKRLDTLKKVVPPTAPAMSQTIVDLLENPVGELYWEHQEARNARVMTLDSLDIPALPKKA